MILCRPTAAYVKIFPRDHQAKQVIKKILKLECRVKNKGIKLCREGQVKYHSDKWFKTCIIVDSLIICIYWHEA